MSLISEIGLRLPFDKLRARRSDFSWSADSDRASTPLSPQFDINSAQPSICIALSLVFSFWLVCKYILVKQLSSILQNKAI